MSSRRRRLATNLLLALGAVVVALFGIEATLRLVPEPVAPQWAPDPRAAGLRELRWFDLGVPNTYGSYKNVPYRVNSAGFRGRDVTRTPPEGTFRIVLIGDSVTTGGGLTERETYAGRTEAALDDFGPGRFEVLNLGVPGPNLQGLLDARLVPIGLPLHPHRPAFGRRERRGA